VTLQAPELWPQIQLSKSCSGASPPIPAFGGLQGGHVAFQNNVRGACCFALWGSQDVLHHGFFFILVAMGLTKDNGHHLDLLIEDIHIIHVYRYIK
jgi:hypothetical protein